MTRNLRENDGKDGAKPNNTSSNWCWGGERGKCFWLDIGLDSGWPDVEHKCTCPDRCVEGSWFTEEPWL